MKRYLLSDIRYECADEIPIATYKTYNGFKIGLLKHFEEMLKKSNEPDLKNNGFPHEIYFGFKVRIIDAEED